MDYELEKLDQSLPLNLDYTGEFGPELVLFLPFVNWLSSKGLLTNRKITTYKGMNCFYDDLYCKEIIEKSQKRCYTPLHYRPNWLPVKNEHNFDLNGPSPQHLYPDLRDKFSKLTLTSNLGSYPLLIIHNKYNDEWSSGPHNHIDIDTLRILFNKLSNKFTIVYIRHGISVNNYDFVHDDNSLLPFNDYDVLKEFPQVLSFEDLYISHLAQGGSQSLNLFKNLLYSRCYNFISSQGGGSHQIAFYKGSRIAILHKRGSEIEWAYEKGYYQFIPSIPHKLAICQSYDELIKSLDLFL
jgi:hypothetical protein